MSPRRAGSMQASRYGSGAAWRMSCPVEQLHRVEGTRLVDAVVEDANDPRVVERREDLIFALERVARRAGLSAASGWMRLRARSSPATRSRTR